VISAVALLWWLRQAGPHASEEEHGTAERSTWIGAQDNRTGGSPLWRFTSTTLVGHKEQPPVCRSITLTPNERKDLIHRMKRERKPSRMLRMHIVLLVADGHRLTRIARALYCLHTTVYAIVGRFVEEGEAAFEDRKRRGPRPLLDVPANENIERLVEEDLPPEQHGWLRSRWRCKHLAVDNDSSHTSKRVEKYVEDLGGRTQLHPLPS
jgi:transposase